MMNCNRLLEKRCWMLDIGLLLLDIEGVKVGRRVPHDHDEKKPALVEGSRAVNFSKP
jgi:hypothetical protein